MRLTVSKVTTETAQKQYGQINTMGNIFIEFFREFMFTSIQDCADTDIEETLERRRWIVYLISSESGIGNSGDR